MNTSLIWTSRTLFKGLIKAQKEVEKRTEKAMMRAVEYLRAYATSEKLSGQILGVVTNNLRGGVRTDVQVLGNIVIGTVGTNVCYGMFWEKGFVPGQNARPWLEPAFEESKTKILEILGREVEKRIVIVE